MANLLLKKGTYENFKSNIFDPEKNIANAVEGALYFTEDEGGLYLGKSDKTVVRIQGTLHQYDTLKDFTSENSPPFSKDIVYFIADRDALIRWNGSAWVQLNTPAAFSDQLQKDIAKNTQDIEEQTSKIANIESNYVKTETFNTTITDINKDIKDINDVLGLTDSVTGNTIGSRIAALESANTTNEQNITTNREKIEELTNTVTTLENNSATKEQLETLETNLTNEIDNLKDEIGSPSDKEAQIEATGLYKELEEVTIKSNTNETNISTNTNAIREIVNTTIPSLATKEELGQLDTDFNNLKNEVGHSSNVETGIEATGLYKELEKVTAKVNTNETNIATNINDIKEIVDITIPNLANDLKAEIDADILAANAMTYKGGVASNNELVAKTPAIGDTYVVTNEEGLILTDGTVAYAGDLLIAQSTNGEEVDGVIPNNQLKWDHVSTGYSSIHNPTLGVQNVTDNNQKVIGSIINLLDFTETNSIGQVQLESASENIVISVDPEKTNVIKFELQWGSF